MIPRISSRLTGSGGLGSEKERIDDESICFQGVVSNYGFIFPCTNYQIYLLELDLVV